MRTMCGTILAAAMAFDCAAAIPSLREIRGPFPILSVAYHKDGSVDYDTIVEEARYVDACGCPGVIWGQSDDAVDFLTLREKEQSYEALAKGMQGRNIVLVFGCNGATADEMLACVDAAQKAADRYPAAKIALSARPPDDTRTLEDLERAWRRLGETARRPCILQTFTPGKTPTPSVDLLVRLAVDYTDVFGYVKEESGGREVMEKWNVDGGPSVVMDVHCPWLRGSWFVKDCSNEYIYTVGIEEVDAVQKRFCEVLERVQRGGLGFLASDHYSFGRGWNTAKNYTQGLTLTQWALKTWPDTPLVIAFEIPFANARYLTLYPPRFRAFGRDIAAAIKEFLVDCGDKPL